MSVPVIIVTGVSRGIGRAIAEELQSRGAMVVGAARSVADVPAARRLLTVNPQAVALGRGQTFAANAESAAAGAAAWASPKKKSEQPGRRRVA